MNQNKLHIVSFDVPYPPNYGGIIDVFYKIKALYEIGIEIYLHTYEFGRGKPEELNKYCKKIFYYPRKSTLLNLFSSIPFIIKSRSDIQLIRNLHTYNFPILFEGIHTTYPLIKSKFVDTKIIIRAHNIEHNYYWGLAMSETNLFKKFFFWIESFKLKKYEQILKKSNYILTISPFEQTYFKKLFNEKAIYIPVFHTNLNVKNLENNGSKILYHGDLRISDNIKVANFLIDLFKNISHHLVIASSFKNQSIINKISNLSNIQYVTISTDKTLKKLFEETHINLLLTYQKTGIKLKLINSLYQGRFIIANSDMISDTGLEDLCELANSKQEFINAIEKLIKTNYNIETKTIRETKLLAFNTRKNALLIKDLLN